MRAFAHGEVERLVSGKFGREVVCRFARQVAGEQHALALGLKQVAIGRAAMLGARGGNLQEAVVIERALGNRFEVNFLANLHAGGVNPRLHRLDAFELGQEDRGVRGFEVPAAQVDELDEAMVAVHMGDEDVLYGVDRQVARAHLVDGVQTHVDDIAPSVFAGAKGDQGRGAAAVRFRHAVAGSEKGDSHKRASCSECNAKTPPHSFSRGGGEWFSADYSCGPAATRALPASLPSYLAKFLMNLEARSCAFLSHSEGSA